MKLLTLPMLAMVTSMLTACLSSTTTNTTSTTSTEAPANLATEASSTNLAAASLASQAEVLPWLRVPMHYDVLLGQPHIWNETGGILALGLSRTAPAGSTSLALNSTDSLLPQQLIAYYGADGEYYSAQIQSISNKTIYLSTPLKQTITAGSNVWNFYSNGSHPNNRGYNVIADYAVRLLRKGRLNEGVHVLLGDSWFGEGSIYERLKLHLPSATIVNKGIGGNTSRELLSRFDSDVLPTTPNFVWIMTGTNDYWQSVSAETYKANIATLVAKIKAAGAVPIVLDASVGPLNFGRDNITVLSQSYVTALEQLLASSR